MQRRTKKQTRAQQALVRALERDVIVAHVEMQAANGDIDKLIHHYK